MEHQNKSDVEAPAARKVWQDPEFSVLEIDETLSTLPPGSDGNGSGW